MYYVRTHTKFFQLKVLRFVGVSDPSLIECLPPLDVTDVASDGTSTHWL